MLPFIFTHLAIVATVLKRSSFVIESLFRLSYKYGGDEEALNYAIELLRSTDWNKNKQAVEILKSAVDRCSTCWLGLAYVNLAFAYLEGKGIEQCNQKAIYFYFLAEKNGFQLSEELKEMLYELSNEHE